MLTILPGKEQKEKYVRDMFNNIANRYDLLNTLMSLGMDKSWRKFAVKRAEIKPGAKVLDICCGTGMITMEIAKVIGRNGHVTGLDFSESMLSVAQQNISNFELKDVIKLMQGNAMKLPFDDNTFDAVTVGWGLRNVPDIAVVVKEMQRVVKPGGMIVSLDMAKPEIPVFKQLYWLYFEKLVPLMGKLWAKKESAYSYLHDSAKEFPHQRQLTNIFNNNGLTETCYHNLFGGVVAVVEGRK